MNGAPPQPTLAAPPAAPRGTALADYSRFVQRVRRRHSALLGRLPAGLPGFASITALVASLEADGMPVMAALRVARQLVLERLAVLDIEQGADQADITLAMTHLAEATLERALAQALSEIDPRWGVPRNAAGERVEFWIIGMGKLGARELNVSSDIDLIYVYEEDALTDGERPVSTQEYFAQVARRMYALIGDVTDDGFVFRVDLALRPNGNSGPPVVSLAMLEEYFLVQGREWERFAWLKSRVVAPRAAVTSGRALALRALVAPFVYRRYLDYGVFEGLRQLHHKIREEAQRRAAGRPERANDVKLSRGGIREIEFIVQLLQVVRGGQFPEIRTRSTLKALTRLAAAGLMKPETAVQLQQAYVFLRRIEHRIQFLDDQQTHLLPTADRDLGWIAASLGLSCGKDACELIDRLGATREFVSTEFDALLHDGRAPPPRAGCRTCAAPAANLDSDSWLDRLPPELGQRVRSFAANPRVQGLREESRQRIAKLVQRTVDDIRAGNCQVAAALRFVDWIEPLLRRETYLALLVERPNVQRRLLRLLGLARWPMRYLMLHPGVIDELADERTMVERFDPHALMLELEERHDAWHRSGEADEGALLDTLRRAHHAETFRTLVRDVEGRITIEAVADELSALADTIVSCSLRWAWSHLRQRHRDAPRLAVIAYGKLGGKELGYGGDLDVVFLYDDEAEAEADPYRAQEIYAAFVRKLITWLTLRTAAGELFDIDTALRPNGNSGLLVTSISSFESYQRGRGSNTAWTWEHQAITRARFCAGDASLGERFEATRRAVIEAPRDADALRGEIAAMRQKVRDAHPQRDERIDPKHCEGGLMDIEFAVQYLVLAHGGHHPGLRDNLGNIALLKRAEDAGLLAPGIGAAAADAYRELRRAQHRARLDEQPTLFEPAALASERAAGRAVWHAVFGPAA